MTFRTIIEEAGYSYPSNWNEMGSSEKDLWEERMLRSIRRRQRLSEPPSVVRSTLGGMISIVKADHPEAVRLEAEMQDEYIELYGEPDQDPDNSMHGATEILLATDETTNEAVGVSAWGFWENGDGKVRMVYVPPQHRGKRVAEKLLVSMETRMKLKGAKVARFESGPEQEPAHRLYDRNGYERVDEGFGFYKDNPGSVFFRKVLIA